MSNYEITGILRRCSLDDTNFIIDQIDSYINFSDDSGLKELRTSWGGNGIMPLSLAHKLETEIRYLGSNDIAYLRRRMFGYEPAGVSMNEIIDDVSKSNKIKIKQVGSIEYKLEQFALAMADKKVNSMSVDEQQKLFESCKDTIDSNLHDKIIKDLKVRGSYYSPVLLGILGSKLAPELIEGLIIGILANYMGKEAAKALLKETAKRMPFLAALGPIFIAGITGWTIIDIAGPANRKLVPILLWLGVVSLRNGLEEK